ncbi:hypothetical protein [Pedobacter rhodius]|uniref:Lipoprotein n=1 Tax=Pedobacter rhodius TaxID=3004098 RepID=A0ABT4L1B9_9SPHI|nr:hypothetical protein [Pedobacter sp. SJ11]MCZ4224977.1 hypothetical protein [Pedobacter sp. SJ11]
MKRFIIYFIILFSVTSCTSNKNTAEKFTVPKLPVVYKLDSSYHKINSIDTVLNLDDTTRKIIFKTIFMNEDSIKQYGLDTLKFHEPLYYINADHKVEWSFGGINYSTFYSDGKFEKEKTKAFVDVSSKVNISTSEENKNGGGFKRNGTYQAGIYADIIAASKVNDSVLFAIGHPILIRAHVTEAYTKIDQRDSVLERTYFDKIDSAKMIYLKLMFKKK